MFHVWILDGKSWRVWKTYQRYDDAAAVATASRLDGGKATVTMDGSAKDGKMRKNPCRSKAPKGAW